MAKGLKVKDINRNLNNNSVRVRYFPGTTVKRLNHYVIPTLTDDTPDTIIIQSGCNDVPNKNSNPKDYQSHWNSRKALLWSWSKVLI